MIIFITGVTPITLDSLSSGFREKHFHVINLALLSFADFYFIDSQPVP